MNLEIGDDFPVFGDSVHVHYTGRLTNGEVFDSSVTRNELFVFTLGKGEVIKGWDIAVATMRKGERCQVTLAPEYAYGATGSPPKIEPNSVLVFEIELFEWHMPSICGTDRRAVLKKILTVGEGFQSPNWGANVNVDIRGSLLDGTVIDDRSGISFFLGEGSESGIISAIEIALEKMKKGEKCRIFIKEEGFASLAKECVKVKIPNPFQEIVYDVKLNNFEKAKETWEMTTEERLEQSELTKEKGTAYYLQQKYELALNQYKKIITYLGPPDNQDFGEKSNLRNQYLLSGYLNMAICYLKLKKPEEVIKQTNSALELEPHSSKAFFRRGQAYYDIKEWDKAIDDFNRCLEIEPENKAVKNQIIMCKHQQKLHSEHEKKIYRNLLNVLSKEA